MNEPDVIDGQATEVGAELVPTAQPPTTLFRTDDPVEVVERASRVADALKSVLVKQQLTKRIQGKDHVLVEGWTTLGSMVGVVPVCVWTRKLDNGWEARVEARTMDGRVIGAAEAECLTDENRWSKADDYAVRSMAQTRATSKALRAPLGFIVTLAGFSATPAEEMTERRDTERTGASDVPATPLLAAGVYEQLKTLFAQAGTPEGALSTHLDDLKVPAADSLAQRIALCSPEQAEGVRVFLSSLIERKAA